MEEIRVKTGQREHMVLITPLLQRLVTQNNWESGALLVFCPHTTAALTINEAADPDVQSDMCRFMGQLVPLSPLFSHQEGNSDAHIKTSLFGPQILVIVESGSLRLGTWQGVYLCEWDGPRERRIWVQFLPGCNEGRK